MQYAVLQVKWVKKKHLFISYIFTHTYTHTHSHLTAHISWRHPWSQSVISGRQLLQRNLRGQDWSYLSSAVAGFKEPWGWGVGERVHRFKSLCQLTVNILGLYVCQGLGFGFVYFFLVLVAISKFSDYLFIVFKPERAGLMADWRVTELEI